MNNKLICPFCEYELQENRTTNLCCPICGLVAPTKLWQALIQAKQDLEIARKALEHIAELALVHEDIAIADEVVGVFDMTGDKDIADKIRKQIENKE